MLRLTVHGVGRVWILAAGVRAPEVLATSGAARACLARSKCFAMLLAAAGCAGPASDGPASRALAERLVREAGPGDALAVLHHSDIWAEGPGADCPEFVLYADGRVIFREAALRDQDVNPEATGFRTTRLSRDETVELLATPPLAGFLASEERVPGDDLPEGDLSFHRVSRVMLRDDGRWKEVTGYYQRGGEGPFDRVYAALTDFTDERATPWFPAVIEVELREAEGRRTAIPWPEDWPALGGPGTRAIGDSRYLVEFPGDRYRDVMDLWGYLDEHRYVLWALGRKWEVSPRFPFPGEEQWAREGPPSD